MIIYPAIDLKDGKCVRLEQGDMNRATIFNDDPAAQARAFAVQGFSHLHIIDLDGAFAGTPVNRAAVEAILQATDMQTQLGGGIRDMATIESWLTVGVDRVILATAALRDPGLVRDACTEFPGRIAVGVDARNGFVAIQGWVEATEVKTEELAHRFEDAGVATLIYTDINRDGLLHGVNTEATAALARTTNIPIIASGGLAGLADLRQLLKIEQDGVVGVITGRALYDGRLDADEALSLDGVS